MRFAAFVLLACLTMAWDAAAEDRALHGIKGPEDQRIPVSAAEFPWSAVGRLNNGAGGHCSATLIGPRLVATAAHCLWNKRTRRVLTEVSFTFVAGFDRGEYLKASKIKAIHAAPGYVFDEERAKLSGRAADWALLELVEPVGEAIGWVALGEPRPGQRVAVAGYGRDKAFVPLAHLGCHLLEQPYAGVLFHDCDAVQGESGGPVFAWVGGELRLVAINVAVIPSRGEMGVAASINGLLSAARALGAAPSTRRGALSRPSGQDMGAVLGP